MNRVTKGIRQGNNSVHGKHSFKNKVLKNFKLVQPAEIDIDFDDVIVHNECKNDLSNLLNYLSNPKEYKKFGVTPYFKYMISGPAGAGKSTLVRSIAKKANLPIIIVEPSFFFNTKKVLEELDDIFETVYSYVEKGKNCILLFKELQHLSPLTEEISQPLVARLVGYFRELPELVAFATLSYDEGVALSTQLIEKPAFSKEIQLVVPDLKMREEILTNLLHGIPTDKSLDIHKLSLDTYQMTTGDIKEVLNNAALLCLRSGEKAITYDHFAEALAQSDFGYVYDTLNDEERLATAYHEAGHVIAGYYSAPDTYKVSKVDITPRSIYAGITEEEVNEDKKTYFKKDLENKIICLYGGMAAEEYHYKSTTTGVESDLEAATAVAIQLFRLYGMEGSAKPMCLLSNAYSFPAINEVIDKEMILYLRRMYERTKDLIEEHSKALEDLVKALVKNEVLYNKDVMNILKKHPIKK